MHFLCSAFGQHFLGPGAGGVGGRDTSGKRLPESSPLPPSGSNASASLSCRVRLLGNAMSRPPINFVLHMKENGGGTSSGPLSPSSASGMPYASRASFIGLPSGPQVTFLWFEESRAGIWTTDYAQVQSPLCSPHGTPWTGVLTWMSLGITFILQCRV